MTFDVVSEPHKRCGVLNSLRRSFHFKGTRCCISVSSRCGNVRTEMRHVEFPKLEELPRLGSSSPSVSDKHWMMRLAPQSQVLVTLNTAPANLRSQINGLWSARPTDQRNAGTLVHEANPLQEARPRVDLRRLGAAAAPLRRDAGQLQIAA